MRSISSPLSETLSINYLDFNESKISFIDSSLCSRSNLFMKNEQNSLLKTCSSSASFIARRLSDKSLNRNRILVGSENSRDEKKLLKLDEFIDLVKNEYKKTKNIDLLLENEDFKNKYLLACSNSKLELFNKPNSKVEPVSDSLKGGKRKENEKDAANNNKKTNINKIGIKPHKSIKSVLTKGKDSRNVNVPPSKITKKPNIEATVKKEVDKKESTNVEFRKSYAERLKSVYLNSSNMIALKSPKQKYNPNANNNSKKAANKNLIKPNIVKKSNKKPNLNIKTDQTGSNLPSHKKVPNRIYEKKQLTKSSNLFQSKLAKNENLVKSKVNEKNKDTSKILPSQVEKHPFRKVVPEIVSGNEESKQEEEEEEEFTVIEKYLESDIDLAEIDRGNNILKEGKSTLSDETVQFSDLDVLTLENNNAEPEKFQKPQDDLEMRPLKPKCDEYILENIHSGYSMNTTYATNKYQVLNSLNPPIHQYFPDIPINNSKYLLTCNEYAKDEEDIISDINSSSEEAASSPTSLNQTESKVNLEQLEKDIEQRKQCENAVDNALQNIFTFHKSLLKDYFKANENDKNHKIFEEKESDQNWRVFISLPSLYDKHGKMLINLFNRNTECKYFLLSHLK